MEKKLNYSKAIIVYVKELKLKLFLDNTTETKRTTYSKSLRKRGAKATKNFATKKTNKTARKVESAANLSTAASTKTGKATAATARTVIKKLIREKV